MLRARAGHDRSPGTRYRWRLPLRVCLKMRNGSVLEGPAGWRDETREHTQIGSVTEEQRSQAAGDFKTLRAAVLLAAAFVGLAVTARYGDARPRRLGSRQNPQPQNRSPF